MFESQKFPRISHTPNSPGTTNDDRILDNMSHFLHKPLVVLYKMDGSNIMMNTDMLNNRATYPHHDSFNILKAFWSISRYKIPEGYKIYGEWLYARHSIHYKDQLALDNYFQVFSIVNQQYWFSWESVNKMCRSVGWTPVKIACDYMYFTNEKDLLKEISIIAKSVIKKGHEGIIIRSCAGFPQHQFDMNYAKYVRKDHVQTDEHWLKQDIVPNDLKEGITWNDLLSKII